MNRSDCILWTGRLCEDGYGRLGPKLAHRVLWEKERCKIPPGMVLMHSCDVRNCVNLNHLRIGTQQENIADMLAKGRGGIWRDKRGDNNPKARLTGEIVWAIRWLLKPQMMFTRQEVAASFQIPRSTINKIWYGETWKHITLNWPFDMVTK